MKDSLETVAEYVARNFHSTYERLAPGHGWDTQQRSRVEWDEVPIENRGLMIAVVKQLLADGVIQPGPNAIVKE